MAKACASLCWNKFYCCRSFYFGPGAAVTVLLAPTRVLLAPNIRLGCVVEDTLSSSQPPFR